MKRFKVTIQEVSERDVTVYANTEEEAVRIVRDDYKNSTYVLDDSDYSFTTVFCGNTELSTTDYEW